jgi:O-antigen ligase
MTMLADPGPLPATAPRTRPGGIAGVAVVGGMLGVAGAAISWLTAADAWYVAVALLLVVPLVAAANRNPMIAVAVWIVVMPLVVQTDSGATRKVFWLVHRTMPIAMVVLLVVTASAAVATRRLARLGFPELLMAGYVVLSVISIAYTSDEPVAAAYSFYDRVVAPMCLYLVIRLAAPRDRDLRRLGPIVFLLLTQVVIATLAWSAPGTLPSEWLGKVGERTVGSLRSPDVFGTTMIFCALFLLHAGMTSRRPAWRVAGALSFCVGLLMAFLTFSRASWLAAAVALIGAVFVYRGFIRQLLVVLVVAVPLIITSGVLEEQLDFARTRLSSQEAEYTALSRLPVMYAAVRMFEDKPVFGFGYENFERYDRQYQQRVGNLVYPDDKDLSSHNLYLTTLAEQGLVGVAFLLGPAVVWLFRSLARTTKVPRTGFANQRLVACLWIVLTGHVIVNNFSRMQSPFGFGVWWITLGLIATIVQQAREEHVTPAARPAVAA